MRASPSVMQLLVVDDRSRTQCTECIQDGVHQVALAVLMSLSNTQRDLEVLQSLRQHSTKSYIATRHMPSACLLPSGPEVHVRPSAFEFSALGSISTLIVSGPHEQGAFATEESLAGTLSEAS